MERKSLSQSAFVNLRFVVGFGIFVLGVLLALVGLADPSASRHRTGTTGTTPAGSGSILFDQLTSFTLGFVPTQHFLPPGPSDSEAADDFEVFDPQGWTIGQFNFEIGLVGMEPSMLDIRVYPDNNGHPGEPALCSYDGIAGTVHGFEQPVLSVPLPASCALPQGRYWMSVVRSDGAGMSWADGLPNPFPPPFVLGAHAHWHNPGDAFGTGCTGWSDITTCLVDGEPIGGSGEQFKFQICGVTGLGGSPVGCPAEVVSSHLAVTLAVDNGDPGQCGKATTLEVDAGQRVNVCYTITNTGGTTLRFHWLRDNRPPRPFARQLTIEPGQSFHFNRVITAIESEAITAEAQSTDVLPWYFSTVNGFDFVDISGTGTPLNLEDDGSANVTMPFRFNLFGVESNQLCINNNGFMLLDWSKPCSGFYEDASIPNESVPLRSSQIAPFWDDLFTSGNVYYGVAGQEPDRRFIVQWHQKNHYNNGQNDPGTITFQAVLSETTNAVSFQYVDTTFENPQHPEWDRGGSATVGFQSYVRDSFGGALRSLPFHQPLLDPESGITGPATRAFHTTSDATATLNVRAPVINVSPGTLEATVPQGGAIPVPFIINNLGTLELQWQLGESPLGSRSHFPQPSVPVLADRNISSKLDLWDLAPRGRLKPRISHHERGSQLNIFGTTAFAIRYEFTVPPFPTLYQRFNDITDPTNTDPMGDLVARDIFAGAFIGTDFSQHFGIDDCCNNFLSIDTATGELSINMGRVKGAPQIQRWWGMTWDATTNTLFAVGADDFTPTANTTFFLARIEKGHEVTATIIGGLQGVPQGIAIVGIAVDPIGRMFGIDILGDRLFAIDKDAAEISPIGALGFNANGAVGLDFDDGIGTLYLTSIDDNSGVANLYTVNTATGEASVVGQLINGNQHTALAIASGTTCAPPGDVPWLSVSPSSGNVPPGGAQELTAQMDASELTIGTYHANVCVGSNDPVRPLLTVPVTLTVTGAGTPTPTATTTPTATGTSTPTPRPTATPRNSPIPRPRPTPQPRP
jgi:hypothetical protein